MPCESSYKKRENFTSKQAYSIIFIRKIYEFNIKFKENFNTVVMQNLVKNIIILIISPWSVMSPVYRRFEPM